MTSRRSTNFASLVLTMSLALAGCEGAPGTGGDGAEERGRVDGDAARALVAEGATLLDVRTPGEFADGHLDGALNVPVQALPAGAAELPKDRPVVVYCRSGRRSAAAAEMLRARGWEVHDLGPQSAW